LMNTSLLPSARWAYRTLLPCVVLSEIHELSLYCLLAPVTSQCHAISPVMVAHVLSSMPFVLDVTTLS
jgi:hypothetical protein